MNAADIDDPAALGLRLAQMTVPAFVYATNSLSPDERELFFQAFFAAISGMAQGLIGHDATVAALTTVAGMPPIDNTVRQAH